MFIKDSEIRKVNSSEITHYEKTLGDIEKEEDKIVSDFDKDIKNILGNNLYTYLYNKNMIKPSFLRNFHFSDIPNQDTFITSNGKGISVREYFKKRVTKFFETRTKEIRDELEGKDLDNSILEKYVPECFALASLGLLTFHRKKGMKIRDVQKLAGLAMCYGDIAELGTGEGKTISAVLPVYFHALRGKGVHVVTANSYLSKRDYIELSPVYEGLGLSCGYVKTNEEEKDRNKLIESKKKAYSADITYSPKDEVAFDYLRDSTSKKIEDVVTRKNKVGYAVIDEVDDILVDSANSPYVIAGYPRIFNENMTLLDLANAMSINLSEIITELNRRGITISSDTKLSYEEASAIADLFSKELEIDNHDRLLVAQVFYSQLEKKEMEISASDRKVFEKYKNELELNNGIMRVYNARLYELLFGEEQDLESANYYGKYGYDPEDIHILRKYAKLIVCPTSNAFFINNKTLEEYFKIQFLSNPNTLKIINSEKDIILKYLTKDDYTISKNGIVNLTVNGLNKILRNNQLIRLLPKTCLEYNNLIYNRNEYGSYYYHILAQTIIANELLKLNEDYTINNGKIVLLKNAREQPGSSYSNGLHQAIETKEIFNNRIKVTNENPSLASVTQKDYYGRYELFSGMTGTSAKKIFSERYGKTTLNIPRDSYYSYHSKRLRRLNRNNSIEPSGVEIRRTLFAKNNLDKFSLILNSIRESESIEPNAPVLIVVSDPNELNYLEKFLKSNGITPNVLSSSRIDSEKSKEEESKIVALAGRSGAVTIATIMAGRGTDIKLGGDRDVLIEYATNKAMREKKIDESLRDEIRILCEESLVKQKLIPTKEEEEKVRTQLEKVGLKVIASGFFDSERIDRQLEGRTGRNGISGIVERFSSPEDLIHLGLERILDEPLMELFNRTPRYGDGSLKLSPKDYDRLTEAIATLQKNNDIGVSKSIEFTQDICAIATNEMEKIRDKRRELLEYTADDKTLLKNEELIKEEVTNMFTMTIDNLLVSYMRNNKFESDQDILIDSNLKELADIDYEGLKLALREELGLQIDIDSFKNTDTSILEFRTALVEHMKSEHDRLLEKNKKEQLEKDVYALLHRDDYNISNINFQIDYIRKQKSLDYVTGNEQANNMAIMMMSEVLKDLKCSSCKAGTRILFGTILPKEEKKQLETHRKELFDIQIINNEPNDPKSKEDSSEEIVTFRNIINKFIEKNNYDLEYNKEIISRKLEKGKEIDIPSFYRNLLIRPMGFVLTVSNEFTLVRTIPTKKDLLDNKKQI